MIALARSVIPPRAGNLHVSVLKDGRDMVAICENCFVFVGKDVVRDGEVHTRWALGAYPFPAIVFSRPDFKADAFFVESLPKPEPRNVRAPVPRGWRKAAVPPPKGTIVLLRDPWSPGGWAKHPFNPIFVAYHELSPRH